MNDKIKLFDGLAYMNHFASWTIEEGVPPYNKQWAHSLASACDQISIRDAELARITAERDAYKRIIDDVRAGNYDNAHDITAARKFIFAELGKMPR